MDLERILKNIQHIEADRGYTNRSRRLLVGGSRIEREAFQPLHILLHGLQFGSAMALACILLIFIAGGFSVWDSAAPFHLSSLNPESLRAEAEAVDIQIQLTGIAYPEPLDSRETTPAVTAQAKKRAEGLGLRGEATSSSEPTIDDVLDVLAQ